jgi:hypothetical protein
MVPVERPVYGCWDGGVDLALEVRVVGGTGGGAAVAAMPLGVPVVAVAEMAAGVVVASCPAEGAHPEALNEVHRSS